MSSVLSDKHFHNEAAAYAWVEARVWPEGPVCPNCGGVERISKMGGKSTRIGVCKCYQCRKPFTVKVGTIFESSHVALNLWLQAMFLMTSSKKGISANQLHRTLGVTLKTAWFMAHRIREAMGDLGGEPLGGRGKTVEVDETFIGKPDQTFVNGKGWMGKRGTGTKRKVISLVERGGRVRSIKVADLTRATIRKVLFENVVLDSALNTDEAQQLQGARTRVRQPRMGHPLIR